MEWNRGNRADGTVRPLSTIRSPTAYVQPDRRHRARGGSLPEGATASDARAVGAALQREEFFNGRNLGMSTRVERASDTLVLSLKLDEEMLRAEDARRYFGDLARIVGNEAAPGKPFEIRLCDEDWEVRATVSGRR